MALQALRRRLLVVDDDPKSRFIAERHLMNAGYDVLAAEDVAPAMAILEREGPAGFGAVVTDDCMPGGTGLDLLRARNAAEAAKGSTDITRSISAVSQGAKATNQGAGNTLSAAQELAKLAADLRAIVEKGHVRTDTRDEPAANRPARTTGATASRTSPVTPEPRCSQL